MKVELQVLGTSQSLLAVQVKVVDPPHLSGADPEPAVTTALQPPVDEAEAFHAAKEASMAA